MLVLLLLLLLRSGHETWQRGYEALRMMLSMSSILAAASARAMAVPLGYCQSMTAQLSAIVSTTILLTSAESARALGAGVDGLAGMAEPVGAAAVAGMGERRLTSASSPSQQFTPTLLYEVGRGRYTCVQGGYWARGVRKTVN